MNGSESQMRAKSHDQRKGQWLINKIRSQEDFPNFWVKELNMPFEERSRAEKSVIEQRLWNMENDEFDKLMEDYNE